MKGLKKIVAGVAVVAVLAGNAGAWEISERVKTGLKVAGAVAGIAVASYATYKVYNQYEEASNARQRIFNKAKMNLWNDKIIEDNARARIKNNKLDIKCLGGWESSNLTKVELNRRIEARVAELLK